MLVWVDQSKLSQKTHKDIQVNVLIKEELESIDLNSL